MANKRQKLDIELLRLRNQAQPEKTKEGLKLLIAKFGSNDPVMKLVENEVKLEVCLLENEQHILRNYNAEKSPLSSLKKTLQDLTTCDLKSSQFKVAEEASFLLAKISFVMEDFSESLKVFEKFVLPTSPKNLPLYKKRMISEMYAIKGLCSDQQNAFKNENVIECYETSIQFLIHYLTEYEKAFSSHVMISDENLVSSFSETAIYRCTVLHIKAGTLWKGVKVLRRMMKTLHTHLPLRIQQVISCKLALILLRGTSSAKYEMEKSDYSSTLSSPNSSFFDPRRKSESFVDSEDSFLPSTVTPLKPKFFLGEKNFNPVCIEQEVVLLLLISEIMLNMDPVLDMSSEHAKSREETLCNAELVYNLLAVACSQLGQYDLLNMSIEKSLKYAFDRHHIWQQYALSLCVMSKTAQALPCLSECCRIKSDPASALQAAKLCYGDRPPRLDEGLRFANLAVEMSKECFDSDGLESRGHLAVGVGFSLKALTSSYNQDRLFFRTNALSAYTKSHAADSHDHKAIMFQAYELAHTRKLKQAFKKVVQAISMEPEEIFAHHLLALLFTARGQYEEAKRTIENVLEMFPNDITLHMTKCKIAQHTGEEDAALRSCDEIIRLCALFPEITLSPGVETATERMTNDGLSVANLSVGGELDTGSILANSVACSRFGQTLSDMTSSLADMHPRLAAISLKRIEAWLKVAEVYLDLDHLNEAEKCINEAASIQKFLPSVIYMMGRLYERRGQVAEAETMYNNTLTIDPFHVKATSHLGELLCRQDKVGVAKKLFQDAILKDSSNHIIWQNLTEVLELEEEVDAAVECSSFALELEKTSPLLPFSTLVPFL